MHIHHFNLSFSDAVRGGKRGGGGVYAIRVTFAFPLKQ